MTTTPAATAVDELLVRHEEPLRAFAAKLTDQPGELLARVRERAIERYAVDAPGELARPWLLRLAAVVHTGREPQPSADLDLVAAYLALPRATRALLWHVAVEGQDAEAVGAELGLEPAVVLAQVRAGAGDLRAAVLAGYSPEGRPAECRRVHRREVQAPQRPLTTAEQARADEHACGCDWCGSLLDQLALAANGLRSTLAVSALGSLAPLYLATRPEPARSLAPPVIPVVAGLRRTAVEHQRPIVGAGVVAAVAAGVLGVVSLQPMGGQEQVYTADGAIVDIREPGTSGTEVVGEPGADAGAPGAGSGAGPGAGSGVAPRAGAPGPGADAGPGDGPGGGRPDGGRPDEERPGDGRPGDGPGGPGDEPAPGDGGEPEGSSPLLDLDVRLDPIAVDARLGIAPLVGRDQSVHIGVDKVGLDGLVDLEIPLLGSRMGVLGGRSVAGEVASRAMDAGVERGSADQFGRVRRSAATRSEDGPRGERVGEPETDDAERGDARDGRAAAPSVRGGSRAERAPERATGSRAAGPKARGHAAPERDRADRRERRAGARKAPAAEAGRHHSTGRGPDAVRELLRGLLGRRG